MNTSTFEISEHNFEFMDLPIEDSFNARDWLAEELKQGRLPDSYKKEHKIIDPRTEEESFTERELGIYCNRIIARLSSTAWTRKNLVKDRPIPTFDIKVIDSDTVNGSVIPTFSPPLILLTKGLLDLALKQGESVIAAVLSHEFWHYISRGYIKAEKNTKLEEGLGYSFPVLMLFHSGYRYTALEDILNMSQGYNPLLRILQMFDVHPSPDLSRRIIEDSYVVVNQTIKRTGMIYNPPEKEFESDVDHYTVQKAVELKCYDSIATKISEFSHRFYSNSAAKYEVSEEFLRWIMTVVPDWLKEDIDPYELSRRNDLVNEMLNNIFNGIFEVTGIDEELIEVFIDFGLRSPFEINVLGVIKYMSKGEKNVESKFLSTRKNLIPCSPILYQLDHAIRELLEIDASTSIERCIELAKSFWEALSQINPSQYRQISSIFFGIFVDMSTATDDYDMYLSGDLHDNADSAYKLFQEGSNLSELVISSKRYQLLIRNASQEMSEKGSMYIIQALTALGISHPSYASVVVDQVVHINDNLRYFDINPATFFIDHDGNIITNAKSIIELFQSHSRGAVGHNIECRIITDPSSLESWMRDRRDVIVAQTREELDFKLSEEITRQRESIQSYDEFIDFLLESNYEQVVQLINSINNPNDLDYLLNNYPYFFALRPRLMGGIYSSTNRLYSIMACNILVEKLSHLLNENPDTWRNIVFENLFNRDDSTLSVFSPTRKLQNEYSLYLLDGRHQFLIYNIYSQTDDGSNSRTEYTTDLISSLEMGLPINHPYIRLLINNFQNFPIGQVLGVLDRTFFIRQRSMDGNWFDRPETLEESKMIYQMIIGTQEQVDSESELKRRLLIAKTFDNLDPDSMFRSRKEYKSKFLTIMVREDILNYLDGIEDTTFLSAEIIQMIIEISKVPIEETHENVYEGYESQSHHKRDDYGAYGEEIIEEVEEQLDKIFNNIDVIIERDPLEVARLYVLFEEEGFFRKYPKYRFGEDGSRGFDEVLLRLVSSIEDPHTQQQICEEIIFKTGVESVKVRDKLIDIWVEIIYKQLGGDPFNAFEEPVEGQDINKTVFVERFQNLVETLKSNIGNRPDMVGRLSEVISRRLNLQYHNTKYLSDELDSLMSKSGLDSAQGKGFLFEGGHEFITSDEETRLLTIGLLTNSLSDEAIQEYIDHLEVRRDRELKKSYFQRSGLDFFMALSKDPVNTIYATATEKIDFKSKIIRSRIEGQIRLTYENFWARNFEERTYILSTLIFPHNREIRTDKDVEPLINYVLDKVLPFDSDLAMDVGRNVEVDLARDFILAYAKVTPINEQRLLFSALMASAHSFANEDHGSSEYIGKALATILSNLGPAGVKLAQAIHSYPETPETIRQGMSDVKGNINLPKRLSVFERLIKIMGIKEANSKFSYIGSFLGGGSYQYTLQAFLEDRDEAVALTLLRDHANAYAKNEFTHIEKAMEYFIEVRRHKGKVINENTIESIGNLIKAARNNIDIETNYEINTQQLELMRQMYKGNVIEIDGVKVFVDVVTSIEFHQEFRMDQEGSDNLAYKIDTIAPGVSLNSAQFYSLPSVDRERVAISMELLEYMIIFAGLSFEHDRQGENMHILYLQEDTVINQTSYPAGSFIIIHFDPGAIYMNAITEDDIGYLADVIISVLRAYMEHQDIDLTEVFLAVMKTKSKQANSEYVSSLFRAFLARSDIRRHIDSKDYLIELFKTIYRSGISSPILFGKLLASAGGDMQIMQFLLSLNQESSTSSSHEIEVIEYSEKLKQL